MNRLLIVLVGATFAMTAVAAIAENAVEESRAGLAAIHDQGPTEALAADRRAAEPRATALMREPRQFTPLWAENWRGGRVHPPAGR